MPANLPPEYYSAEIKYKQASTPQEKVFALEALIATIPKHKGAEKLREELRRILSNLRDELSSKKQGGRGELYSVERQGAAQASLVGFANSGKSSLLAAATHAHPVVADYPMSTLMPLAGMMPFEDIQFQLVDLPPVGNELTDGWLSGILRTSNLLIFVVDLSEDPDVQTELLIEQMAEWEIPIIRKSIINERKDSISPKPVIIAANKYDLPDTEERLARLEKRYSIDFSIVPVAAKNKRGIELFKRAVFMNAHVVRVYCKEQGKSPDMAKPFTLPAGSDVLDLSRIIHKDVVGNLKFANIWGSGKVEVQRVQKDYLLKDKDVVEFHFK